MLPTVNKNAIIIGTTEFSFSKDATSLSDARLRGWVDVGTIKSMTPKFEKTEVEHKSSRRGKLVKDMTRVTEESINYELTCEEWKKSNLLIIFRGEAGDGFTQSGGTAQLQDTWAFTSTTPAVIGNWYDITKSAARVMRPTAVQLATGSATSVAFNFTTDVFTATAHGLSAGDPIILRGTPPTGFSQNTTYYTLLLTSDTFQLSLTVGGAPITSADAGTGITFWKVLLQGTDFEVDDVLGRVRFTAAQTATIQPIVSSPAIAADGANFLHSMTPLEDAEVEGYGRLVVFDQHDAGVVVDHRDFKCKIKADTTGAFDGTNWTELKLNVQALSDEIGTIFNREA